MNVTKIPAPAAVVPPPRYQLDLSENELLRIAICLAKSENGHPKVYDSLPEEIKRKRERIRSEGRDHEFMAEGAKP